MTGNGMLTLLQGLLPILFQPLDGNRFQSDPSCWVILQHVPHVLTNQFGSSERHNGMV